MSPGTRPNGLLACLPGPWHLSLIVERLLTRNIHALEYDPLVQYRFHQFFMGLWGITLFILPFFPVLYGHSLGTLIIQEISFYANFATDFGAMTAALAAMRLHCKGCRCNQREIDW